MSRRAKRSSNKLMRLSFRRAAARSQPAAGRESAFFMGFCKLWLPRSGKNGNQEHFFDKLLAVVLLFASGASRTGFLRLRPFPGSRLFRIGFDGHFDLRAFFQAHGIALFIVQHILDADLLIQLFGAVHGNLRRFRFSRINRRDDLLNRSRKRDGWLIFRALFSLNFVAHGMPPDLASVLNRISIPPDRKRTVYTVYKRPATPILCVPFAFHLRERWIRMR